MDDVDTTPTTAAANMYLQNALLDHNELINENQSDPLSTPEMNSEVTPVTTDMYGAAGMSGSLSTVPPQPLDATGVPPTNEDKRWS
ncbi:unnamed protein product [Didymodactylos carnosus]|uniref:Uncharacterized protein n=1 Tax=Didymodactylos carnosus TaxID=1234261 RepID=A0A814DF32_9BILA|nr:unnamed protein product [Didymodactylos carnosus]CAF1329081.1 unnamed protein product [Didymodactylos carnosus]CAF3731206.1 unnamed protein product [Didymodactylos carnosus]CAF4140438.1 unnamed protein product [Didymodactylos carnosus]